MAEKTFEINQIVREESTTTPAKIIRLDGPLAILEDGRGNRRRAEVSKLAPWPGSMQRG